MGSDMFWFFDDPVTLMLVGLTESAAQTVSFFELQ